MKIDMNDPRFMNLIQSKLIGYIVQDPEHFGDYWMGNGYGDGDGGMIMFGDLVLLDASLAGIEEFMEEYFQYVNSRDDSDDSDD